MPPAAYLRASSDFDRSGLACTKIPYTSRKEALMVAKVQRPSPSQSLVKSAKALGALNVYRCAEPGCSAFHLGHWPAKASKDDKTRAKKALARLKASKHGGGTA